MSYLHSALALALASAPFALVGCSDDSDGPGGSTPFVYSGSVRSPHGQPLRAGAFPDLGPVPDGTPIELARLDAGGATLEVLAQTTTLGGDYTLVVDGAAPASDLALVAGSGAQRLRALAVGAEVDIDPFTETGVQLVLTRAVGLTPFTGEEFLDTAGTVELIAVVRGLGVGVDVTETVERFRTAALAEPAFVAFLDAAAAPGQTTRSPGDLGDHFPLRTDDLWGLRVSSADNGLPLEDVTLERRTLAPSGTTWPMRSRVALAEETTALEDFEEREEDVRRLGGDDVEAFLGGVPDVRLRFPLRTGKTWLALETEGASFGRDLDFDTLSETVDARIVRTVVGFEDVVTPAETFANCVRVDSAGELVIHPTGSTQDIAGTLVASEWYAAEIGLVRRHELVQVSNFGLQFQRDELLDSRRIDGEGHGILPAVTVADGLGSELCFGPPVSACDGTNRLLVTTRENAGEQTLIGLLLDPDGQVLRETSLLTLTPTGSGECQINNLALVFDGTNYLVAFVDQRLIWLVRVSPAGDVLDPLPIQVTEAGDHADFRLTMAFDGTNALLVWHRFVEFPGQIYACFVTPEGSVLGAFQLLDRAPGSELALVHGDESYLLAWADGEAGGIVATRVSHSGVALDTPPVPVSTSLSFVETQLALGFDGTNFLVLATHRTVDPTDQLLARHIGPDGSLLEPLDEPPVVVCTSFASKAYPTIAFDGANYLVAWVKTTAPTAVHLVELSPAGERLDGATDTDGRTILGPFGPGYTQILAETALSVGGGSALLDWLQMPGAQGLTGRVEAVVIHPLE